MVVTISELHSERYNSASYRQFQYFSFLFGTPIGDTLITATQTKEDVRDISLNNVAKKKSDSFTAYLRLSAPHTSPLSLIAS
jgi:hypothetical protein